MQMLDGRNNQQGGKQGSNQGNSQPTRHPNGTTPSTTAHQQPATPSPDDFDDDIPFFNFYEGKGYLV